MRGNRFKKRRFPRLALVVTAACCAFACTLISSQDSAPIAESAENSILFSLSERSLPAGFSKDLGLISTPSGTLEFSSLPPLASNELQSAGHTLHLTIDQELQYHAEELLKSNKVPWGAVVAIDPRTGEVLALASHSEAQPSQRSLALRSGFPAASLFKIVSAAAAIEETDIIPDSVIRYRGGDYTLNRRNYLPKRSRDKRRMSLETALAKSCNPVFARLAMQHLSPELLSSYAERFGFNHPLAADVPVMLSVYDAPADDYEFARTAAGFGDVTLSPLHAASLMAMVAHEGKLISPHLISHISAPDGSELYKAPRASGRQVILPSTAKQLMEMLAVTTTKGTARRQFKRSRKLRNMEISGKTGTLSGDAPKGRYYWFVGAAPASKPEVAVAALVIDPGGARINGTGLGRRFLEHYFEQSA